MNHRHEFTNEKDFLNTLHDQHAANFQNSNLRIEFLTERNPSFFTANLLELKGGKWQRYGNFASPCNEDVITDIKKELLIFSND